MAMTWVPERPGNWLFHCHIMHHVSMERRLGADEANANHGAGDHSGHHGGDMSLGMAGMVVGVTVRDPGAAPARAANHGSPRRLTLLMQRVPGGSGEVPAAGFILSENGAPPASGTTASPGPPIVLRRDQPVEITLVNRLPEATAMHWRGMELESFYDGVHGWSSAGTSVTPVAKDGAPLPAGEAVALPARQTIAVGETYDFEYQAPAARKNAWLEVRSTGGRWQVQGLVIIK